MRLHSLVVTVLVALGALRLPRGAEAVYATNNDGDILDVLVKFRKVSGIPEPIPYNATVLYRFDRFDMIRLAIPRLHLHRLQDRDDVDFVEVERVRPMVPPDEGNADGRDLFLNNLAEPQRTPWGIERVLQGGLIDPGPDAGDIRVCVVDTGYDLGHQDLPPDATGTDTEEGGSWSSDGSGHGTHCAGTIAALNNDQGVVGCVGDGSDSGITLHIGKGLNDQGSGSWGSVLEAVDGCIDAGARIVSMSLGCSGDDCFSESFNAVVNQAYSELGVLFIAAAGNDGNQVLGYPASYPAVMSVAAMDSREQLASFSQYNYQVEITGPGVDVESTWTGGGYRSIQGTSMACPHVSGVAALLWSYESSCTPKQIRKILLASAKPLGLKKCATTYGRGLVQAQTAINMLLQYGCDAAELADPDLDLLRPEDGVYEGCRLKIGDECDTHGECLSGFCIPDKCTEFGHPDNRPCNTDGKCGDGGGCGCNSGACGRESYTQDAAWICCPSGATAQSFVPGSSFFTSFYCTEFPTGAACGTNAQCESGVCIKGECAAGKQDKSKPCDDPDDCINGACGRATYEEGSVDICCPSDQLVELEMPEFWLYTDYFCTEVEDGAACYNDGLCKNGACGQASYSENAPWVCCPSGKHVEAADPEWGVFTSQYCTGMETGEPCGVNEQCSSGVCVNGICKSSEQVVGRPCDDSSDCKNDACGREFWEEGSKTVCCPSGETIETEPPGFWIQYDTFCTGQAPNSACNSDDMCENKACGQESYTRDAPWICCPSGEHVERPIPGLSIFTSQFCTEAPTNAPTKAPTKAPTRARTKPTKGPNPRCFKRSQKCSKSKKRRCCGSNVCLKGKCRPCLKGNKLCRSSKHCCKTFKCVKVGMKKNGKPRKKCRKVS